VRMLWHVLLPCSVLTMFFARPLMRLVFGVAYEPAAPALRILTPFYLLNVVVTMSYFLMTAVNRQMLVMKLALLATAANVGVGIWMMRLFGIQGAVLTVVVSEALVALVYWRFVRGLGIRIFRTRHDVYQWVGFGGSVSLCVLVRRFVVVHHWLELLAIGLVIALTYAVFLFCADGFLPEEITLLTDIKTKVMG
jgi:O-antigen/teichoic acid export membrane protein